MPYVITLRIVYLHGYFNALRSIYSRWDCLNESFMMQSKVNAHNHRFLRYKQFSIQWLLISWSFGGFLRCRGLPSIIGKVFLRAFQCNLDHQKRPSIHRDRSKWSLWQGEWLGYTVTPELKIPSNSSTRGHMAWYWLSGAHSRALLKYRADVMFSRRFESFLVYIVDSQFFCTHWFATE